MAMPVDGAPPGWTARVLLLHRSDGTIEPYFHLIKYMREHSRKSPTWQDKVARALGLLWDFSQTQGVKIATEQPIDFQRTLFRRFAEALEQGTIICGGHDETGLFWPKMSWQRVRELTNSIETFAAWSYAEFGHNPFDATFHKRPPISGVDVTATLVWSRVRQISMMVHADRQVSDPRRVTFIDHGRNPQGVGAEPVKYFPPDKIEDLLWIGYKRRGKEHEANPFIRYDVKDIMISLLDGWGGLRRSEGFHCWIQDVVEEPGRPGHALVVLNHPSEAMLEHFDSTTGRTIKDSRANVLKQRYPPYLPRHHVTRGRYRAGWKGVDLNREKQAFVFWIDPNAAALFWVLYLGYIRYIRTPIMARRKVLGGANHPFLFITEGDSRLDGSAMIGDPYTPKAYERNHQAAVLKIGLEHTKYASTTTQGLRHHYGQTLEQLGVPPQVIKKGLHHRHYLSQVPYTAPDRNRINAILNNA
jgi:hypothetical protein